MKALRSGAEEQKGGVGGFAAVQQVEVLEQGFRGGVGPQRKAALTAGGVIARLAMISRNPTLVTAHRADVAEKRGTFCLENLATQEHETAPKLTNSTAAPLPGNHCLCDQRFSHPCGIQQGACRHAYG